MKKSKEIPGTKFILIFSPCPTGWNYSPDQTIHIARLATKTGIFLLYEIENGEKYHLNRRRSEKPIKEYFSLQGRFRSLKEEGLRQVEERIRKDWEHLIRLAG